MCRDPVLSKCSPRTCNFSVEIERQRGRGCMMAEQTDLSA